MLLILALMLFLRWKTQDRKREHVQLRAEEEVGTDLGFGCTCCGVILLRVCAVDRR